MPVGFLPSRPTSPGLLSPTLGDQVLYFHVDTKCQIKVSTRKSLFQNETLWLTRAREVLAAKHARRICRR